MSVATYSDVGVALGRTITSGAEQDQVDWWLSGAELVIKSRLGDLSLLDQDVLKYVEVEAVAGKVRRSGREESSITVTADDGSVTRRYDSMTASDIGDDLWALLRPSWSGTAYSIPVSSPLDLA